MNKHFARRTIAGALSLAVAAVAGAASAPTGVSAQEKKVQLVIGLRLGGDTAAPVGVASAFGGKATDLVAEARKALAALNARTVEVPASKQAAVIAALRAQPGVDYVEVDRATASISDVQPNDPLYTGGSQPEISRVKLPAAWEKTTGGVKVAVLDTGVNGYDDLAGGVVTGGYNFVHNNRSVFDDNGHGSAVSSIIAARGNDGYGMAGSCWKCTILPVKVMNAAGSGAWSDIAKGVVYAADNGAKVINMSLGGQESTRVLQDAVAYASGKGVLVVASAGNDGDNKYATTKQYPAAYPEVLAVGATARNKDSRAPYSSYNAKGAAWVDIAAPGDVTALTQEIDGQGNPLYGMWQGTSFAAPMVAGAAALVKSAHPTYNNWSLQRAILSSGRKISTTNWTTYGALDVAKALTVGTDTTAPKVSITAPGYRVHGTVTVSTSASDNWSGLRVANLYVDGKYKAQDKSAPFSFPLNTKSLAAGKHTLTVKAYDMAGNGVTSGARAIFADNVAPTVWIKSGPKNNAKVKGTVTLQVGAYDSQTGIRRVEVLVNGKVKASDASNPYTVKFAAAKQPKTMKIRIRAIDNAGNVKYSGYRTFKR